MSDRPTIWCVRCKLLSLWQSSRSCSSSSRSGPSCKGSIFDFKHKEFQRRDLPAPGPAEIPLPRPGPEEIFFAGAPDGDKPISY